MSEAEKAWGAYAFTLDYPCGEEGEAFLAGAEWGVKWQRERDAQIVKKVAERVIDDALNSDPNPWPDPNSADDEVAVMVAVIVDAVRKQDAP